jgi:hypothetical protein
MEPHSVTQALNVAAVELVHLPVLLKKRKMWAVVNVLHHAQLSES